MHIHYLSSSTLISDSANAVHVMKMAEALKSIGHDVTLHALHGSGNTPDDVFNYYNVCSEHRFNLELHDQNEVWVCRFLNGLKDRFSALRIGGLPSLIYASTALKIKNKADLLFSRNMYWLFPFRKTLPFIYETHSPPETAIHRYSEKKLIYADNCRGIVVISEKLKEIYLDIFPDIEDKIIVAHDAAEEPEGADQAIADTLKRPVRHIGYVGHLYQGRGIDVIIETAKELPDHQFHIVGGRADLVEELSASSPGNMIYHGHRPYKELAGFYKTFDIVLAPYQRKVAVHGNAGETSQFMSPLKIFEYMAWGLPVVCSDLPVLKEVLSDRKNALLVSPDKSEAWVGAINTISSDNKLRQSLVQNARRDFLQNYTWSSRARFILHNTNIT